MASTKSKRAGVVAGLAASLTLMMGGTAFASSPNPANPGEIPGSTYATVVAIVADNSHLLSVPASSPTPTADPSNPGEIPGSTYATVVTLVADNSHLL
ncbi:MAG: hypothetical protein LC792_11120 [Actinobacteria bacterium]|nr:hypothetical protein [Actinomycetota bacterium]